MAFSADVKSKNVTKANPWITKYVKPELSDGPISYLELIGLFILAQVDLLYASKHVKKVTQIIFPHVRREIGNTDGWH